MNTKRGHGEEKRNHVVLCDSYSEDTWRVSISTNRETTNGKTRKCTVHRRLIRHRFCSAYSSPRVFASSTNDCPKSRWIMINEGNEKRLWTKTERVTSLLSNEPFYNYNQIAIFVLILFKTTLNMYSSIHAIQMKFYDRMIVK